MLLTCGHASHRAEACSLGRDLLQVGAREERRGEVKRFAEPVERDLLRDHLARFVGRDCPIGHFDEFGQVLLGQAAPASCQAQP